MAQRENTAMIFFTADLHFGHANIIKHCNRPFATAEEMDAVLTQKWNATVGQKDEVYILGDFTMRPAMESHRYLAPLNGRKYLIRGNHDRFLKGFSPIHG
jgi:calcineurin-like phosphoesterase family protein